MQGLVKYGHAPDQVEIREVPRPALTDDTVIIRAAAVGVCGSDIHMWHDTHSWEDRLPVVLGHETAGTVAEVGRNVTGWQVGDRVVAETAARICGACALCRTGSYNLCPHREGYGATRDGAFAELVSVEPRLLHRIPDAVPMTSAALTEPYAVVFNALVERTRIRPGDLVVVQGVGAIGTLAVQIARLQGAGRIVVLGVAADAARLATVRRIGADETLDVTAVDATARLAELGDGLGADVVVDATGVSAALRQGLALVRPAGRIVKIGWGPQPLDFSLDPLVAKAVTLFGSFSHTWDTWERVLRLLGTGALDPAPIVGGVYELDRWRDGFSDMAEGRVTKSVITFA